MFFEENCCNHTFSSIAASIQPNTRKKHLGLHTPPHFTSSHSGSVVKVKKYTIVMVLVTLAWMTHSPGCHNCLVVTTWYATILTDRETDKLLLLRNILMQIGSWCVGTTHWVGITWMKMDAVGPLRSGIPDPYTYQDLLDPIGPGTGPEFRTLLVPLWMKVDWQWMKIDNSGWKWNGGIFTQTETLSNGYTGRPRKIWFLNFPADVPFGPLRAIWATLGHLGNSGPFGPLWATLGHFGPFCT